MAWRLLRLLLLVPARTAGWLGVRRAVAWDYDEPVLGLDEQQTEILSRCIDAVREERQARVVLFEEGDMRQRGAASWLAACKKEREVAFQTLDVEFQDGGLRADTSHLGISAEGEAASDIPGAEPQYLPYSSTTSIQDLQQVFVRQEHQ